MSTQRKDENYSGLREFLRENLNSTDLSVILISTIFGGYFSLSYYGVLSITIPVMIFTVITIEVVLWYSRNFNIISVKNTASTVLQDEGVRAPPVLKQTKDDWRIAIGLFGSVSGWLVLLGIISATPAEPLYRTSLTRQLILEIGLAAKALVALGIFITSIDLLITRLRTSETRDENKPE